jgi:meso-butanediol dehydrogenase/(S,S)-butanediol dehydrogenase/diacetyl reductase
MSADAGTPRSILVVHSSTAVGRAAVERFRRNGDRAHAVDAHAGDARSRRSAIEEVVRSDGGMDVLVVAAADAAPDPVWAPSSASTRQADEILRLAFFWIQDAAPHMTGGRIALAAPPRPPGVASAEPASLVEGALVALVRLLAVELAPRAITLNAVCPNAAGGDADAVAAALVFLVSPAASYLTGAWVPVSLGARPDRPRRETAERAALDGEAE